MKKTKEKNKRRISSKYKRKKAKIITKDKRKIKKQKEF